LRKIDSSRTLFPQREQTMRISSVTVIHPMRIVDLAAIIAVKIMMKEKKMNSLSFGL